MINKFNGEIVEPTAEELEAIEAEISAMGIQTEEEGGTDLGDSPMDAVGEEQVGGTVLMPEQDVVDELGAAVGLEMDDRAFLRTTEILEERDDRRWEFEPKSSEDYSERRGEA
jgi:hypothetical protein